jgi:cytoskeletal protein RodZ
LPSFGEKLKLEREKRKITLEEISSSTKIGTRMLQALEEEKFNQLPGGIFNKGFVRAYARVVGLDEDQTVADYLAASGDAPPVRPELVRSDGTTREAREAEENRITRLEAISESPSRPLPWGVMAVILLVIALALSLWSHRRREQERLAASAPPARAAVQSSAAPSPQESAASATAAPTSAAQTLPVSAPTTAPTGPAATVAERTPAPGEFTVTIQAREQSWVSITVDGKSTGSEVLEAGTDRTLRGRKQVVVKAGNAGALEFRLNGKKLDVGGDFGEVKTVTIGPAGLVSTPPAASPAP